MIQRCQFMSIRVRPLVAWSIWIELNLGEFVRQSWIATYRRRWIETRRLRCSASLRRLPVPSLPTLVLPREAGPASGAGSPFVGVLASTSRGSSSVPGVCCDGTSVPPSGRPWRTSRMVGLTTSEVVMVDSALVMVAIFLVVTVVSLIAACVMTRRNGCASGPWMMAVVVFGPVALGFLVAFLRRRSVSSVGASSLRNGS